MEYVFIAIKRLQLNSSEYLPGETVCGLTSDEIPAPAKEVFNLLGVDCLTLEEAAAQNGD